MTTIADEITARLQPLVGLKLSIARRAADMRGFHFGQVRRVENGTVGEHALHTFVSATDRLAVEAVQGDAYGGATITLPGGFRLVLFPAGSEGEDRRLFQPGNDEPHVVVAGGKVEMSV